MQIYDPPPPGFYAAGVAEPPPPPEPRHLAPRTALWVGARAGWFIPFGEVWARTNGTHVNGVPWNDYASSGPMFELNAGLRLSRNYNVFALWERAYLGPGKGDSQSTTLSGKSDHGDTDFWGVGIRASSDPDHIGFVTELAIGYRRARSIYENGDQIQFTDSPFETRIGVGADFRVNNVLSISPMATIGLGSFGTIETVSNGQIRSATTPYDQSDAHAWATFTLGGHFDLLGSEK